MAAHVKIEWNDDKTIAKVTNTLLTIGSYIGEFKLNSRREYHFKPAKFATFTPETLIEIGNTLKYINKFRNFVDNYKPLPQPDLKDYIKFKQQKLKTIGKF